MRTILSSLAAGDSIEQIVHSFPTVTEEVVRAVISVATASDQAES